MANRTLLSKPDEAIQIERCAHAQAEAAVERLQAQLHESDERTRQLEAAPAPELPKPKRRAPKYPVLRSDPRLGPLRRSPSRWRGGCRGTGGKRRR